MKDDTSTPTSEGASPNEFERDKAGTTDRSRAEAAIEELRQRGGVFVNAVRATRMPMVLTDPNLPGNPIVFANEAFLKLSGYRIEEVLGQQPHFMNGPTTDPNDAARFAEAVRSDQDDIIETVQYRKNGSRFVATVLLSAFKDERGNVLNHFMSWLDVTRRVDAEDELASQRAAQAALGEELRNTRILHDLGTRLVSEDDVQTIYDEVLTAAIEITQARAGTVQMLDLETDELVVLATRGFSPATQEYFQRVDARSLSGTSCGLALRTGERAYLNFDPQSDDMAARMHVGDGVLSAQSFPLVSRSGNAIGMVSTHWGEPDRRLSERESRFLDLLGRQTADLVEQRASADALHRSERNAQALLAELQHRVRNTLAVVRSIARRTADQSSDLEEMVAHFEGRLNAYSRVQAAVTRSAGTRVSLKEIIGDEMLAVAVREGTQLTMSGPDLELQPKPAESISLAVHELATNAMKYGAIVAPQGKIRVKWNVVRSNGTSELQFEWAETGLNEKPTQSREGFGHEMLLRTLPYELDGDTSITFTEDGLRFTMRMPLGPGVLAEHGAE